MGFFTATQTFKYIIMVCTFLFLLLLLHTPSSSALISSSSSSSPSSPSPSPSSHEIQPQFQVLYIKNTNPLFLDKQEANKKLKRRRMVKRKQVNNNYFKTRPFSVMLPKGFVPPSGSSPCHNENPNSVVFFCDLAKP